MGELGSFSRCTIEGDSDFGQRDKQLRGKSLAISLAIEATLISALLLLPLLSTGVLPPLLISTPAPPYRGNVHSLHHASPPPSPRQHILAFDPVAHGPLPRPERFNTAPPAMGDPIDQEDTAGPQPGVPGGDDHGATINLAPPPSISHTKPFAQSEGLMTARLIRRVQPNYPRIAELMRLSGVVHLRAIVATDGSVQQLEVLSGNPILAQAALDAVRQWRYEPTRLNGQAVEVQTSITITFVLN